MYNHINKKDYFWILILLILLSFLFFLFFYFNKYDKAITGSVVKENLNILNKRLGFDGVRDPINKSKSKLVFMGGSGKSIKGSFNEWNGNLYIENKKIVGFEGGIIVDSIDTEINSIKKELKGKKFLNSETYTEIRFISLNLTNGKIIGELDFMGVTREIIFPVNITEESISSDFLLYIKSFNIKDPRAGNDVRIIFEFFK